MQTPPGAPPWLEAFTAAERPDLWELTRRTRVFERVWPEYNLHGRHSRHYFGGLLPRFAHVQVIFCDRRIERPVARVRTIPLRWDGSLEDLPSGIDDAGRRAVDGHAAPTVLLALAAEVLPDRRGGGLSALLIRAMAQMGRDARLTRVVAPVRPSQKERYPMVPIERYVNWRRDDGLPFDPWLRVHARLGGTILRCAPRSMDITAPVAEWETWTDMRFPGDGAYVFPGGLAPLHVSGAVGEYYEPNVWVVHEIDRT